MIVLSNYRGFRIEVEAVAVVAGCRYNADVRMLRLFSHEKPRIERVTCYKLTPDLAEHAGELWARRWVDVNGTDAT